MSTRPIALIPMVFALLCAAPAWSYDVAMAESYAQLFEPVNGAGAGKALHLMSPAAFVEKVKANQPLVTLDVRTFAESGIYTSILPGALVIPIDRLFMPQNLARIPVDKTVVVLCMSGTRATAAGTALRHIGFDNVYVLKGGFKALAAYLGPKEANPTPDKPAAKR
jgi:rhodanese-related sulfurtransferase